MKRIPHIFAFLFLTALVISSCKNEKTPENYLRKVLGNLEKIETAVYEETRQAWNPGDKDPVYTECFYVEEYRNPADTTIGSSFISLECADTSRLYFAYDGVVRIVPYHENNGMIIDNFTARPLPFRPMNSPFFNNVENIIRYILTTNDSITVEMQDLADEYYLKLTIHEDRQIEFFGKAHRMEDNSMYYDDMTSIYELWFNKKKNLPYKVRREMAHSISANTCLEAEFNTLSINDLNIYSYIPQDYEVREYRVRGNERPPSELLGKKAPDWLLNDMYEQPLALADLKSKVLLLNFTGIGCGACMIAIPFLNTIKSEFTAEEVGLVSIETWIRKPQSLQNYAEKYKIDYTFLSANDVITEQYQTGRAAPFFFVLDKDRIIRHVFTGYAKDSTDVEIKEAIKKLL